MPSGVFCAAAASSIALTESICSRSKIRIEMGKRRASSPSALRTARMRMTTPRSSEPRDVPIVPEKRRRARSSVPRRQRPPGTLDDPLVKGAGQLFRLGLVIGAEQARLISLRQRIGFTRVKDPDRSIAKSDPVHARNTAGALAPSSSTETVLSARRIDERYRRCGTDCPWRGSYGAIPEGRIRYPGFSSPSKAAFKLDDKHGASLRTEAPGDSHVTVRRIVRRSS